MCLFGIAGLFLMIAECEIRFAQPCDADTYSSWWIRLIISTTTAILVICVVCYHHADLNLCAVNCSLSYWRIGLTTNKMLLIATEAFVCAVHPIPGYSPSPLQFNCPNSSTVSNPASNDYTPMNVTLRVPSECNDNVYRTFR